MKPTHIKKQLVRARDIAKRYDVTERSVFNWKDAGKIPFIQIGKIIRFDLDAVIEAIEGKQEAEKYKQEAEMLDRITRAEIILGRLATVYWHHILNNYGAGKKIGDQVMDYWRKYNAPNADVEAREE